MKEADARLERQRLVRLALLAGLMFVQHAALAAWAPLMPLRLADLGFSASQVANLYGVLSIASVLAPWLGGQLADRVLPAQIVILLGNVACAAVLWRVASETRYTWMVGLLLAGQCLYIPTFALCNHIVMSNLRDGMRTFGYVRLWGTAGWVVGSLLIGLWLSKPAWMPFIERAELPDSLRLGAVLSLAGAALCLFVPNTPPARGPLRSKLAGAAALRLLREPDVAVLMLVSFLVSLTLPFSYPHGGLFLRALGVSDAGVAPVLSLAQMLELVTFASLALLLERFGFKRLFIVGLVCWAVRFAIWSLGHPFGLVAVAVSLHGVFYAFVFGLGQMYLNHRSPPGARASVQSMHIVLTTGLATWPANWLAGLASDRFRRPLPDGSLAVDYGLVFVGPAVLAAACCVLFAVLFRPARPAAAAGAS